MINALKHNFGMKILSLALALVIWGITRAADPYDERTLQPEILVKLKPQTALLSRNPSATHAMVRVRGRASLLDRVQTSNPRIVLDAHSLGVGQTGSLKPRLEPNIRGITAEFESSAYKVSIDELSKAEFAPEQVTEGRLDPGFFLDSVNEDFSVVIVDGAKTLVDKVKRVVYVINLSLLTGSTKLTVQFEARDENNKKIDYLHVTPSSADITINLQPSQASKSVPIVPDFQGQPAANYAVTSISSEPFLGEVSGSTEALAKVVNLRTTPINLTGKISSFEQSVNLIPPSGGISLLTSQVTVSVEIQQISSSATFENLPVEIRGEAPEYDYSLSTDRVNVTIIGGVDRLAQVTSDLIRPQVDVTGLGPGTHEIRVLVALPNSVSKEDISPESVSVTIKQKSDSSGGSAPGGNDNRPG